MHMCVCARAGISIYVYLAVWGTLLAHVNYILVESLEGSTRCASLFDLCTLLLSPPLFFISLIYSSHDRPLPGYLCVSIMCLLFFPSTYRCPPICAPAFLVVVPCVLFLCGAVGVLGPFLTFRGFGRLLSFIFSVCFPCRLVVFGACVSSIVCLSGNYV